MEELGTNKQIDGQSINSEEECCNIKSKLYDRLDMFT